MDYKKDIKDTGLVSHRAQGGMEVFSITLSKKCERLATAIYLITNFLSDTEPMKARLRALSLDLVRDASFIKNGNQAVETNVLEQLRANILETLSLLELAFIAGLVSEMNFTILKREYASLRDSIEVKKASRESRTDTILGDNFFASSEPVSHSGSSRSDLESADSRLGRNNLSPRSDLYVSASNNFASPKGQSIGQTTTTMSDRNVSASSPRSDLESADSRLGRKNSGPKVGPLHASVSTPRAITDVAKESRRTRILKLIKDNREVSIKDIVAHFPDLSEKTIQRELVSMSDSGVLKKSGERRWSRYALA